MYYGFQTILNEKKVVICGGADGLRLFLTKLAKCKLGCNGKFSDSSGQEYDSFDEINKDDRRILIICDVVTGGATLYCDNEIVGDCECNDGRTIINLQIRKIPSEQLQHLLQIMAEVLPLA